MSEENKWRTITWFLICSDSAIGVEKMDGKFQVNWCRCVEMDVEQKTIKFVFDNGYEENYRLIKHGQFLYAGSVRWYAEVEPLCPNS